MEIENVAIDNTDFLNKNIKREKKQNVFYVILCKSQFLYF